MKLFKTFGATTAELMEDAVNAYCDEHKLKAVQIQYAAYNNYHTVAVLFEHADPVSETTATEIQLQRETNEMLGRKIVEKGGITVMIRGRTGSGKSVISDMLGKLAYDYGISYEHECEQRVDCLYDETAEIVKLGSKGHRK